MANLVHVKSYFYLARHQAGYLYIVMALIYFQL